MVSEIYSNFSTSGMETKLCVPINDTAQLSGRQTSSKIKSMEITIKKCNSSVDLSRPCANDTEIQALLQLSGGFFSAGLFSINPLINPGNSVDYLDYEVMDRDSLSFDLAYGTMGTKYIEDYTI